LANARDDAADLRIFDAASNPVPYELRVLRSGRSAETYEAAEVSRVTVGDATEITLDLGENPPEHNQVQINVEGDRFRRAVSVFGSEDAAVLTALGLHALQHRGQEGCGIVTFDNQRFHTERHLGLVGDNFSGEGLPERLPGTMAIGHTRYATQGGTILRNVQPLFADLAIGGFAVGHNGNLTNARLLREQLVDDGAIFQSTSDTECLLQLIARSRRAKVVDRFVEALHQIQGAYAFVCLTNGMMIGARDPQGIRPLVLGERNGAPILASETCALDMIGAKFIRTVENGEVVVVNDRYGIRFTDVISAAERVQKLK